MLAYTIFSLIFIAIISYYYPEELNKPKETPENHMKSTYDFIIVGAGSAGCVMARRLSEVKSWRILLLEAGGDETDESKVPLFVPLQVNNAITWNYTTVKQERACLATNGICAYPRGHVMGGCSSVNYMLYVRGNKLDYDEWEKDGADGWSYKNVQPYFLKAENIGIPELYGSSYHSRGGLLSVQYPSYESNITQNIIRAGEELGMKHRDYNGEHQTSISKVQMTIKRPIRWSASSAYLMDLNRSNLNIIKNAKVTKIVIDPETKTVTGVIYRKNGKTKFISAAKEVILSAGAINSPQILMLSGVGPKSHLTELNIPLIADLPVGNNLQDQFLIPIALKMKNYTNLYIDNHLTVDNMLKFAQNKTGIFTNSGASITSFLNTGPDITLEPPDIQYHFFENTPDKTDIFQIMITVVKPQSSGTVRLNSSNIDDAPLIDPNYFAERDDLDKALKGIEIAMKLMQSKAMEMYSPEISESSLELCARNQSDDKAYLTCLAKTYSQTIYHPTGTCKMGSTKSPSTVVSPELKVLGINNLRVIDASVMPNVTRGNTNAPTIMIAEKASDIIKSNYKI